MTDSKWIKFELVEQKPKTQIWGVVTKWGENCLGTISWYSPWRQYAFFPRNDTVFAGSCFSDIAKFIEGLMKERRERGWKSKRKL